MTKAVLFQKSGQPVLFTDYAEYDTGTGYIVAENKEKESAIFAESLINQKYSITMTEFYPL